ncbi:O-methyltransferase [Proteiniphilum saccharofermentans]|uniref:O-methyltransferase n=1 Tax=Proteiniphilum saccharofermentans TaxID=1642647 RepID=A0A1R3T5U9_9BACT|nr:class I SAM-dependent methyltransferase [Proteiniphilum saccharofermentans]SCD21582.1 O-methyltransferase [Proteiniphilum saccharofermentans]SEA26821.1 O-methyltransferase [Porphyromonadaceae bacterium KH3R12]SFS53124.1 O-methyltransferase [Porphyromonadaceae bacterium NLAE-zl-C104]
MKLEAPLKQAYESDHLTASEAQRMAHLIAFAPVVFQVARLMHKFGIFSLLRDSDNGLTMDKVAERVGISRYAAQVLLESSLTAGTVLLKDERFYLSKTGWFFLTDPMIEVNMSFNHDVNYLGLFSLEEALLNGKPEGLKVFGDWPTIYEGLSSLPDQVRKSWFGFDHFYSDNSFPQALEVVFAHSPKTLLDVGGNTGRWSLQCVNHSPDVQVTIMDLPQQIGLMKSQTEHLPEADRIHGYQADLLDPETSFPGPFDAIWMSQFLDCFSEEQVFSIVSRAGKSMTGNTRLFVMETFWDRQRFETSAFCLAQTSVYFTAMANGNSKMYYSGDMMRIIEKAGLKIDKIHDNIGLGHSILECVKNEE